MVVYADMMSPGAEEGAGWDGYSVCDAGLLRSGYQGQLRYGE